MRNKKYVFILVFIGLFSCSRSFNEMDPQLAGFWTDTNTKYHFFEDGDTLRYGARYLRLGVVPDSIYNDSSFGTLEIDLKRNNLTFNLRGYMTRDSIFIDTLLNSTTWHYEITDDTLLHYETNTMLGTFTKVK